MLPCLGSSAGRLLILEKEIDELKRTVESLQSESETKISSELKLQKENENMKERIENLQAENFSLNADMREIAMCQIDVGFKRRSEEFVNQVFDEHSTIESETGGGMLKVIYKDKLRMAMSAVGIDIKDDAACEELMYLADTNRDGVLDIEEFKRAIRFPTPLLQWAETLPLAALLCDAIPKRDGVDRLRAASQMSAEDIEDVCSFFAAGLQRAMTQSLTELRAALDVEDRKAQQDVNVAANKFAVMPLSCGVIANFHEGLAGRIGHPHLKFTEAMKAEHCYKAGKDFSFTTSNYKITTTPSTEWAITVDFQVDGADVRHGRRLIRIQDHMESDFVRACRLAECEVIAVVLYTGPMFVIFNAILRQWPKEMYATFLAGGNLFSTSISVLTSAVQKVSRSIKIPQGLRLFRGLGGTFELPQCYYKADQYGCRGFVEWGFMSTTSDKETAVLYSGVKDGKPLAIVLEAISGAVARGACIRDLSQYPGEIEYLWPPCSFVEPRGPPRLEVTQLGIVTVIPVYINANIKSRTIEQLVGEKKSIHLTAFDYLIAEIAQNLQDEAERGGLQARLDKDPFREDEGVIHTPELIISKIVEQCRHFYDKHKSRAAEEFADDEKFKAMVMELLEVKTMSLAKLRLYLTDKTTLIYAVHAMELREAYRALVAFYRRALPAVGGEERKQVAEELCRLEGLLLDKVNELSEPRIVSAAAEGLSTESLELLLLAGASVNQTDGSGNTALHVAARYGQVEAARALVANKADLHSSNQEGETTIILAAENGNVEAVRLLIANNADINSRDKEGRTPVYMASRSGRLEVLHALIDSKADVNIFNNNMAAPINLAAQNGHLEVVRTLILSLADVNVKDASGSNAALVAAQNGHIEILRALIEGKADVNSTKNDGWSGMMKAIQKGHVDAALLLIKTKADVNTSAANGGSTPLTIAAEHGHLQVIHALLNAEAQINSVTADGTSALIFATLNGRNEAALALIEAKADVNLKNQKGYAPLIVASMKGNLDVMRALIEAKADVNASENNQVCCISWAANKGHAEAVRQLIQSQADVNAKDKWGDSAIVEAVQNRNEECIRLLLEAKAVVPDFK